jgi:hypothetical protein
MKLTSCWRHRLLLFAPLVAAFVAPQGVQAAPARVSFAQSATSVEAYDFVEVTLDVAAPDAQNPSIEVQVEGRFGKTGDSRQLSVDGFCDSVDGSVFRIRFMPTSPGDYSFSVTYRQGSFTQSHTGSFQATNGHRRGVLRVDPEHRWHFIWEGTGEHYFFNGTTAFLLMGFADEKVIQAAIDRLHGLKVNRMRVLLSARPNLVFNGFWSEPILPSKEFRVCLNPWIAERPDSAENPGFDYTRLNVPYWQKYERMLRRAREEDLIVSVILDWNDSLVHPAAGGEDEQRYYRYAAARLGAYSSVTWDLGDDIDSFRDLAWAHKMGTLLEGWDAYHHLATDHPVNNEQQDRTADWFGFTSFQYWPRPLHGWMVAQRQRQEKLGRIIPQTDEEYGYEDHYPRWSPSYPDGASADANRRAAWEISMAGAYQTTGETAKRGTGAWPDTGGGWVNGRGDDSMVMLQGYAHMVDFFTSFDWWRTDLHDELVSDGAFCLAEPGGLYAVYLPMGGAVAAKLEPGRYQASWFNPRSGRTLALPPAEGPAWTSPTAPDSGDWALLLRRTDAGK